MKHINRATILGNVGADPERHEAREGGRALVTFSVATNHGWKDDAGELHESTEWHRVVAWGALADLVEQHMVKGDLVLVEGRLKTRAWQDTAGMERRTTEIHAGDVIFLGIRETS